MSLSLDREKAIAIAINLLKHKSLRLVQALKDLLTFIPNPNYTRDILESAVIRLIYTCPEPVLWLFQHPEVVESHIQVREIIAQELTHNLLAWGYTSDNFHFTPDYSLKMSENLKSYLFDCQKDDPDQAIVTLLINLLLL